MTEIRQQTGLLIVFEGTDGTGKSTQIPLLQDYLVSKGFQVISTREPTDGQYGQKIREIYHNREYYSPEKELQLFLLDRREHVEKLIQPALECGKIVLSDRYFLSTAAYQGALGFDPESILAQNSFAPDPDLALIFSAPIEVSLQRITTSRGEAPNDFEKRENLELVARNFAAIERSYIVPINASESIQGIHQKIIELVKPLLDNIGEQTNHA